MSDLSAMINELNKIKFKVARYRMNETIRETSEMNLTQLNGYLVTKNPKKIQIDIIELD